MGKVMLGELLVGAGLVSEEQVLVALRGQRAAGLPLGHYLVRSGILSEEELVRALSQQLGVPIVLLDSLRLPDDALRKVSADFARANLVVPFKLEGRTLHVATADPTRDELLGELRISSHCDVRFSMATPSSIDRALEKGYLGRAVPSGAVGPGMTAPAGGAPNPGRTGSFAAPTAAALAAAQPGAFASLGSIDPPAASPLERRISELEATVAKLVAAVVKGNLARREDLTTVPPAGGATKAPPSRP